MRAKTTLGLSQGGQRNGAVSLTSLLSIDVDLCITLEMGGC